MSTNLDDQKATKISLFSFSTPAMRAFHMSWLAFFVCFFAWFACAPLMPVISGEFHLTTTKLPTLTLPQWRLPFWFASSLVHCVTNIIQCKTYTALLFLGSIPVF